MTTDELIEYYVDLLIMQYEALPNARETIAAYVATVIADQIAQQVEDAFNFNTGVGGPVGSAAGVQMDVVASYRGLKRQIFGIILNRSYFSMPLYGDPDAATAPGFALYGQSPILDYFLTYENAEQPVYTMNDDELFRLTQLRAVCQSMLLSVKNIDDALFPFFDDNVTVFDEENMTITYIDLITDPDNLFTVAAASGTLPRPAGVKLSALRSETLSNFFGFQNYGAAINPDFVGFGLYGSPQTGSFVRYA